MAKNKWLILAFTITKIIVLQIFWYLSLRLGEGYEGLIYAAALGLVYINFIIYRPQISKGQYIFTLVFFISFGIIQDSLFEKLSLVSYGQESFPLWLSSLHVIFIAYYGDVFNVFVKRYKWEQALFGAIGSVLAYSVAVKISAITILSPWYYIFLALSWSVFFPLSIMIFYKGLFWNKLLDIRKS